MSKEHGTIRVYTDDNGNPLVGINGIKELPDGYTSKDWINTLKLIGELLLRQTKGMMEEQ